MRLRFLLIAMVLLLAPAAFGGTYSLNDWCFYVNSLDVNRSCNNGSGVDNFNPPVTPGTTDYLHLGDNNTLGTTTITLSAGSYNVFAIFNYNLTAGGGLDEYAAALGSLAIGQVYSVDTQGASGSTPGGLYTQFAAGTLDNVNHLPACAGTDCPDVSVAMGYTNLVVPDGSTATVNFIVSDTAPSSGFYVQQGQNGSGSTINFSSTLDISGGESFGASAIANPEPGTVLLMAGGLGLMLRQLRRRKKA
jgi:hypothetical protein